MVLPLRALVPVLVLTLALFSGCMDGPEKPAQDAAAPVITDPGDFDYLLNGSAPGSHIHDYWNGEDTRFVLDEESACANCFRSYEGDHGAVMASFRPEPDQIVPQGTAWLEVTASWTAEAGEFGSVALFVKTANETDVRFVQELEDGETFRITSTNADNDPPHHRLSLWRFEMRAMPKPGASEASVQGWQATMSVFAVRGLPIPVYPPHPDLWNGLTESIIHEEEETVEHHYGTPQVEGCNGCVGPLAVRDGGIVPYDASHVDVEVVVTEGMPPNFRLLFHGADTWDLAAAPLHAEETMRKVWRIPVDDRMDSPYAKQTLWEFRLENIQPAEGFQFYKGTFETTIRVVKA